MDECVEGKKHTLSCLASIDTDSLNFPKHTNASCNRATASGVSVKFNIDIFGSGCYLAGSGSGGRARIKFAHKNQNARRTYPPLSQMLPL
jgi:hypothetical protein